MLRVKIGERKIHQHVEVNIQICEFISMVSQISLTTSGNQYWYLKISCSWNLLFLKISVDRIPQKGKFSGARSDYFRRFLALPDFQHLMIHSSKCYPITLKCLEPSKCSLIIYLILYSHFQNIHKKCITKLGSC